MSLRQIYVALFCSILLSVGAIARAGMTADTPYTERGKADFDTALQLINPYGTWAKINDNWAFTPTDHHAPYTEGRWLYTEFGWYWKGRAPHSWLTEHYGYWKRSADKVWSWYPGAFWLPQIVELRSTSSYIGWRSGEVDSDGNFVEAPIDRFSQPEEWTFVTTAQFANPITPGLAAPASVAEQQLDDSTDCHHTYVTYREIYRPGPHPADLVKLCKDGGMLPPRAMADEAADLRSSLPPAPATNSATAIMNGTNRPTILGQELEPGVDLRQVKYWITMSLPAYWTKPPPDAKPDQIYLYRPDFYQDADGIARRITLWFNPKARTSLSEVLGATSLSPGKPAAAGPAIPAMPAEPATAAPDPAQNPFRSPLDEPAPSAVNSHSSPSSSKNPAPAGLATPDGQSGTNDAPLPK